MRRIVLMGGGAILLSLLAIGGLVTSHLGGQATPTPLSGASVLAATDTPMPTATETVTPTTTATPTPAMTIVPAAVAHAPRDWCTLNTVGIRKGLAGYEDLGAYEAYTWNRVITSTVAARYAAFGIPANSLTVTEPVTVSLTAVYGPGTFYVGYWKSEQPKIWKVTYLASGRSAQSPNCLDHAWDTGIVANVPPLGLVRVYILMYCANPIFVPVTQATPTVTGTPATVTPTATGTLTPEATPTSTPQGGATPTPTMTPTPGPSLTPTWTSTPPPGTTPTNTPLPTATNVPPTATPVPPTGTPVPTATPVPPTNTPRPTNTTVFVPSATPTPCCQATPITQVPTPNNTAAPTPTIFVQPPIPSPTPKIGPPPPTVTPGAPTKTPMF